MVIPQYVCIETGNILDEKENMLLYQIHKKDIESGLYLKKEKYDFIKCILYLINKCYIIINMFILVPKKNLKL